jgi:hypothetical protein
MTGKRRKKSWTSGSELLNWIPLPYHEKRRIKKKKREERKRKKKDQTTDENTRRGFIRQFL